MPDLEKYNFDKWTATGGANAGKKHITPSVAMGLQIEVAIGVRGVCFAIQRLVSVVHDLRFTDATGREWFGMECWIVESKTQ